MRGKPVICNETKVVYNTITAAEKDLGLKSGSLSEALKTGEPLSGYTFNYYSPDDKEENKVQPEQVVIEHPSKTNVEPEIEGNKENVFDLVGTIDINTHSNVRRDIRFFSPGTVLTEGFAYQLTSKLVLRGYDCGVVNNEIVFFSIKDDSQIQQLHNLLLQEGYRGWYNITPYDSARYLELHTK